MIGGPQPLVKLLGQFLAAGVLVLTGVQIALFPYEWLNIAATLLWVVFVTNAMNLLDNMDGLSSGIAAIAAVFFLLFAAIGNQYLVGALAAALLGACVGFLYYNLNPASIFMGMPEVFSWLHARRGRPQVALSRQLILCHLDGAGVRPGRPAVRHHPGHRFAPAPSQNPLTTPGKDHLSHRLGACDGQSTRSRSALLSVGRRRRRCRHLYHPSEYPGRVYPGRRRRACRHLRHLAAGASPIPVKELFVNYRTVLIVIATVIVLTAAAACTTVTRRPLRRGTRARSARARGNHSDCANPSRKRGDPGSRCDNPVPVPPADGSRPLAKLSTSDRANAFTGPAPTSVEAGKIYVATIVTPKGNIVAELYPDTPESVNNFVTLAQNGFYDGLTFHRVEPGFVIQVATPAAMAAAGPATPFRPKSSIPTRRAHWPGRARGRG